MTKDFEWKSLCTDTRHSKNKVGEGEMSSGMRV